MKEKVNEAVRFLQKALDFKPDYGIILGTGLGSLVDDIAIEKVIDYAEIPHFPVSTVEVHKGKLIFGHLGGKRVMVMQGRFHYYEGYSMQEVTFPVRVMKLIGIKKLFVSNAAGGLDPDHEMSDLMAITDHINLFPDNPLRGKNIEEFGPRFPDMSEPYDKELLELATQIATEKGFKLRKGIYVGVPGPNLETHAEYAYVRKIGGDAVGMSTVPEVIVAVHMGLPVFAASVITDLCSPGKIEKVSLEYVVAAAKKAEPKLAALFTEMIARQ